MENWTSIGWGLLTQWGGRLLQAAAVLAIGGLLLSGLSQLLKRFMIRRNIDPVIGHFLRMVLRVLGWSVASIVALSQLGVETTSLIAVLGAAGLAVGLALKDSLQNLASGFLLIALRPFHAGDLVDIGGMQGTVRSIELFSTKLITPDNRQVYVPNGQVFGGCIVNYTAGSVRRVDVTVGISYAADLPKACQVLYDAVALEPMLVQEPAPFVGAVEFGSHAVEVSVRVFAKAENYWAARAALMECIQRTLRQQGVEIPFPQMDVHMRAAGE